MTATKTRAIIMGQIYLVADDSLFARMLLKDAIAQINPEATFLETTSGTESINLVNNSESPIDWFLLDINMGEPNGVDTACALIEHGIAREKIALVTGNKSKDLQAHAHSLGLNYINKAISPEDVEGFMERLKAFFNGHGPL